MILRDLTEQRSVTQGLFFRAQMNFRIFLTRFYYKVSPISATNTHFFQDLMTDFNERVINRFVIMSRVT